MPGPKAEYLPAPTGLNNEVAILSNCASGRKIYLRAQHVFGRDRMADTLLESPDTSRLHASVHWTGSAWEIRDHSRNGTLVDGSRIPPGRIVRLKQGSVVAFGHGGIAWRVEDLARPTTLLWPLDGGDAIPLARSNLLPEGPAAELSITQSVTGSWVCTSIHGSHDLEDGDEVRFGGRIWCFLSGADSTSTLEHAAAFGALAEPPALEFRVSLDEEHAWLQITLAGRQFDLGERSHHYALLTLARLRLADAERCLDAAAQGWVEHDRLARMLGLEPAHLNIQIFRLRKQVALALPRGMPAPELIERRRGKLRLRELAFRIMRGSSLQGRFEPLPADNTVVLDETIAI